MFGPVVLVWFATIVALAAMATVIASQAIISGVFSLTRQAIQLGYLPRMEVVHTSGTAIGQIYLPAVNRAVMVATSASNFFGLPPGRVVELGAQIEL